MDETERLIKSKFPGIECAVAGYDDQLYIFITDPALADETLKFIAQATGLNQVSFKIKILDNLPKNESGKILYVKLEDHYD